MVDPASDPKRPHRDARCAKLRRARLALALCGVEHHPDPHAPAHRRVERMDHLGVPELVDLERDARGALRLVDEHDGLLLGTEG